MQYILSSDRPAARSHRKRQHGRAFQSFGGGHFSGTASGPSPKAGSGVGEATGPDEDFDLSQILYRKIQKIHVGHDKDEMVIKLLQVVMGLLEIFTLFYMGGSRKLFWEGNI